jgi:hypothetical protein
MWRHDLCNTPGMGRRIDRHIRRQVTTLDGLWDFAWLGDGDRTTVDVGAIVFDQAMAVPGCWDVMPDYAGERGLAAYARRLPAATYRMRTSIDLRALGWLPTRVNALQRGGATERPQTPLV